MTIGRIHSSGACASSATTPVSHLNKCLPTSGRQNNSSSNNHMQHVISKPMCVSALAALIRATHGEEAE